jgi:hypothetical protein
MNNINIYSNRDKKNRFKQQNNKLDNNKSDNNNKSDLNYQLNEKEFPSLITNTTISKPKLTNNWSKIVQSNSNVKISNNLHNNNSDFSVENYKSYVKKETIIDSDSDSDSDSDMEYYRDRNYDD